VTVPDRRGPLPCGANVVHAAGSKNLPPASRGISNNFLTLTLPSGANRRLLYLSNSPVGLPLSARWRTANGSGPAPVESSLRDRVRKGGAISVRTGPHLSYPLANTQPHCPKAKNFRNEIQVGTIRSKVDNYHFARFSDDRPQVTPLLAWFDVTHAQRTRVGAVAPTLYYLKPGSNEIARYLGVDPDREVVYLFSPFEHLEAREFETVYEARDKDPLRLDHHLALIGSSDPNAGDIVKAFLVQDLERTPIVGFSSAELKNIRSPDDIYTLFRGRHHIRDYFALEGPLTEEALFFGRAELLSTITSRVTGGQNTGVFGLRRIGKTSLLYAIQRRCSAGRIAHAFYKDMSPTFNLRWWEVLELLVHEVSHSMGMAKSVERQLGAVRDGYTEANAAALFGADIQVLVARVVSGRLVIMLDEIENISCDVSPASHWNSDFLALWTTMRSVHQNSRGKFLYLVAGVNPYPLETERIGQYDNPLFSTTKSIFVPPLDYEATGHMMRSLGRMMGVSVEKKLIDAMFDSYGGHPFLTRQACSHLVHHLDQRPAVITAELYLEDRGHLDSILRKIVDQILNVLRTWYPDEFDLLRMLAEGDQEGFLEFIDSDRSFASHVEGYGLVADASCSPALTIRLVKDALVAENVSRSGFHRRRGLGDYQRGSFSAPQSDRDRPASEALNGTRASVWKTEGGPSTSLHWGWAPSLS
jgi:membrane-associated PAP2 superfamily phosphatase